MPAAEKGALAREQPFTEFDLVEVRSPTAGLIDTPNLDQLPPDAAREAVNCNFDPNLIQKRRGVILMGTPIVDAGHTDCRCIYWFQQRDGTSELLRVQNHYLYKWNDGLLDWYGAISGLRPATADDVIGNDNGVLGGFVQFNDKIYWWDGGADRLYYDGSSIQAWGFQGGSLAAGTNTGDTAGYLTAGKTYKWVWTLYNPTTGAETDPSAASDEFSGGDDLALPVGKNKTVAAGGLLTVNQSYDWVYTMVDPATGEESLPSPASKKFKVTGANKKRNIKIGPWTGWASNTNFTTIKVYRSKAGVTGTWYLEGSIVGITNFNTTGQNYTLEVDDTALGAVLGNGLGQNIEIGPWAGWSPDYTGFTTIKIYRTFGDATDSYFFEKEETGIVGFDTVAVTSSLTLADGSLGDEVLFDNAPPPPLLYCTLYGNHIVAVPATDPSSIIWSKTNNPAAWAPVAQQYAERDSGFPLSALWGDQYGRLFMAKFKKGIFVAKLDGLGGITQPQKINGDWGATSHHGVKVFGDLAYGTDLKGAWVFDGQNVESMSDTKIRKTWLRLSGPWLSYAYAARDDQPDRQCLRWLVRDSENGVGIYKHLVFDVTKGSWVIERPGPEVINTDCGADARVLATWIPAAKGFPVLLSGDNLGQVFQHRYDLTGEEVLADVNLDYTFRWASRWYGDGITTLLPIYVEFEMERAAHFKAAGSLTVEFYRDTDSSASYSKDFPLWDEDDVALGGRETMRFRMNLNAAVCNRFSLRFVCDDQELDPRILWFRVRGKTLGMRVIGS